MERRRNKKRSHTEDVDYIWKWWKHKRKKHAGEAKWKTLEHNGPYFPEKYKRLPSTVRFYYDGKPMKLSKRAEEIAGFYGKMLNEKYATKKIFKENFFSDWREAMQPGERFIITDFDKCNFIEIHEYYKEEAKRRKEMTPIEKQAAKRKKDCMAATYGFCFVDGHAQKINNYKIEPPGLFRGRGNNPKMGTVKKRVMPEDVTINIGKKAAIPRPPLGHTWKEVIHDNSVIWLARWTENVMGSTKYIALNQSSKLKGLNEIKKYETARKLKHHIVDIRQKYMNDLLHVHDSLMIKQRAVALYFIDRLALRMGNEKHHVGADTVGCCTLRVEHLKLEFDPTVQNCVIHFNFPGKDSIKFKRSVPVEEIIFKYVRLFMIDKSQRDLLFDQLNPIMLNKYLNEIMPGLTAKVFRTYHASKELEFQLETMTNDTQSLEEKLMVYGLANRCAAVLCNHHRAIPKTFAKSMKNIEKKIKQKMGKVNEITKEVQRTEKRFGRESGDYRSAHSKMKEVPYLKKQIQKLQLDATVKKENKDIALSTSKLSYLDPRITVAWCKKWNVPVEKIYSKAQREIFLWAIETTNANFKF